MSRLEDFLGLNNISETREEIKINVGGKELTLVVRPITNEEHGDFQKRCNVINKNKITFDTGKYTNLIIENCVIEPNFKDAEFLRKANCVSASDFVNKKFPAGVIADISNKIQEISGFNTIDIEIENAKN